MGSGLNGSCDAAHFLPFLCCNARIIGTRPECRPKDTACVNHTADRNQLSYAGELSTVIQDHLWLGSKHPTGLSHPGRKIVRPPSAHHPVVQFILSHPHSTDGNLTDARMSLSKHCNPFGNSERISSVMPALRSILQKSWQVLAVHVQPNGFMECGRSVPIPFP